MESSEKNEIINTSKLKLLNCVIYPGIVNNAKKAINNLGGIFEIANAFENPEASLSVNLVKSEFGPPLVGNKNYENSFFVSVKTKYKVNKNTGEKICIDVMPAKIIGFVHKTFTFTNIVDFAYFPPKPNCSELWHSNKLFDIDWALDKEVPLSLLPSKLSKFNEPQSDFYDLINLKKLDTLSKKHRLRPYVRNFTKNNHFEDTDLPPMPLDLLKYCLTVKMFSPDEKRLMDRLFEKRPIWVKSALFHFAKVINKEKMKYLLPTTGYFTTTGPFRRMWVRHGYNYHTDPSNYIYQMIEIRNQWLDDHSTSNPKKAKFKIEDYNPNTVEKQFYFSTNSFPLSIVANYQLCDIHLPEVQEMIKNAHLSASCSKHAGWLKKEFIEDIRAVMYEYLERAWQKYLTGDLSFCGNEHIKLYRDYMEEDCLDYTSQKITQKLEKVVDDDNKNQDENNEFVVKNDAVADKYEEWATTLNREDLAKIIFSDNRNKTDVSNSNPCSDEEDDVDSKMDSLEIL